MHYMCEAMERIEARGEARSEARRQSRALMMIAVIAGAGGAWAASRSSCAQGDTTLDAGKAFFSITEGDEHARQSKLRFRNSGEIEQPGFTLIMR